MDLDNRTNNEYTSIPVTDDHNSQEKENDDEKSWNMFVLGLLLTTVSGVFSLFTLPFIKKSSNRKYFMYGFFPGIIFAVFLFFYLRKLKKE